MLRSIVYLVYIFIWKKKELENLQVTNKILRDKKNVKNLENEHTTRSFDTVTLLLICGVCCIVVRVAKWELQSGSRKNNVVWGMVFGVGSVLMRGNITQQSGPNIYAE